MTEFHTILIDPPWHEQGGGKIKRGADRHYKLLKTKEMPGLILTSGVFTPAENCHLYLWATNNFLPDGIWLIGQLGFKYITCITWAKPSPGLGQYFHGQTEQLLVAAHEQSPQGRQLDLLEEMPEDQTEQLLFARRGNGWKLKKEWAPKATFTTLLFAERSKNEKGKSIHSAKPEESYALIEAASPPPRLEMFARNRRHGWEVWGNEV